MANPVEIIERMQELKNSYQQLIEESAQETAEQYAELNKQQMYEGKNSDGDEIGQYASEAYANMKNEMNPLPGFGVPDLKLTGAFYQGYAISIEGQDIVQNSPVPYLSNLEGKYGPKIWGLTEENHEQYVEEDFRPVLQEKVSDLTGLLTR